MEKVLFIVPPHITFADFVKPAFNTRIVTKDGGTFGNVLTDMPLGVLSLSAYFKKHSEAEVRLIDFNVVLNKLEHFDSSSFFDFFKASLAELSSKGFVPTIVAISALFSPSYQNMIILAKCCRQLFPQAMIIVGGGVPTNMPAKIFADSAEIEAICFGEGEKPLLGLVAAKDKLAYLRENSSWITREKIDQNKTFKHDFIEDLDEIPFYDYALLNIADYSLNPAITAYASLEEKNQNFHVMTSRGCPYRCCFCSSHTVHGRAMRYYSLARIREDFTRLRDEYGAKILIFQDDHFVADRARALAIIALIKELGFKAVFQNGLALHALNREMLEALKSAGVDQLMLSVESGSERVLKEIMHKPLSLSIIKQVAADCRDLGIYTNVNILIGLPGETREDIEEAREFLEQCIADMSSPWKDFISDTLTML
ncbi:MAG: B12-binding domain-containing radical SAM protein, partial [Candidatus Margulisbacteria bacterium]|nr:B12-binding domain-containing radical SAM protein [Candidatus Margulisiibacteriota bacterium]